MRGLTDASGPGGFRQSLALIGASIRPGSGVMLAIHEAGARRNASDAMPGATP